MYKFKNSLMGLIGVVTLIVVTTVLMPHKGYGSSGASSNAPANQTQNVNVVNTPTVKSQQDGVWNVGLASGSSVGIAGTPTVGLDAANNTVKFDAVNNTVKIDPAAPVPVRDVDNPARQPFAATCTIANNNGFPCTLTTVPPGQRLVFEMFHLQAPNVFPSLTVVTQNTDMTYQFFESSQLVRVYADPGTTVMAAGGPNGTRAAISGYLVDLP